MLKKLYSWTLNLAHKKHSTSFLCLLAFTESIFFPIPVDPVLLVMGTSRPKKAIYFSLAASLFSVLGGIIGYFAGYYLWDLISPYFFEYIFSQEKYMQMTKSFQENAFLATFLAGFTPIPFKVFTLSAGAAHISFPLFLVASIFSRTLRFSLIGVLISIYGPSIKNFIETYFEKISFIVGAIIVLLMVYLNLR